MLTRNLSIISIGASALLRESAAFLREEPIVEALPIRTK
jgi:hypothetical protein